MTNQRIVHSQTDSWEVLRPLGHGGMGQTLLVRSQRTGQQAVLKELHVANLENWKALELFQREADILQALDHPGIPTYLDVIDEGDGVQALVQTFVDGETLGARMRRSPMKAEDLERALRDCLDILAYLRRHSPPVVHRDITPANVMLDNERAYIIDFGSVKWALRESTVNTTVGTFGYMPPEQVMGRAEAASDMYALGMTFLAAATGQDASEFAVDPSTGAVDVRRTLRGTLPENITAVLEAMARPGLGQRLGDPVEALRRLDAPPPAPVAPPPWETHPAQGSPQGASTVALGVLVVAIVIISAVAYFAFGEAPDPQPFDSVEIAVPTPETRRSTETSQPNQEVPEVQEGLSREAIQRVMRQHRREIRACYEMELARDPEMAGQVTMRLSIAGDGSVASASISASTLNNRAVENCIVGRAERLVFPEPADGEPFQLTYPFMFSPEAVRD